MSKNIELSDTMREALAQTKECTTLLDYGTEVPADIMLKFLEQKSKATQQECAIALGYKADSKELLDALKKIASPQNSSIEKKKEESKSKKEPETNDTAISKDFETFSESHGYLYAFARAFTMGYIPQTHDNKFFSEKEAPIDFVRKMKWVAFGGFFTNGSPESIKRGSLHKDITSFYNSVQ